MKTPYQANAIRKDNIMETVNYLTGGEAKMKIHYSLESLDVAINDDDIPYIRRVQKCLLDFHPQ